MKFRCAILASCALFGACLLLAGTARASRPPNAQTGESAHPQRPGYLGVSLRDLDAAEATRFHLQPVAHEATRPPMGVIMGAMIVTVDRDAPAWTSGLRPGDVVLELNAQPVNGVEDLRRRLRECPAGETVTLRVRRGGDDRSFAVPLGDQEAVAQNAFNRHFHPGDGSPPVSSFAGPPGFSSAPAAFAEPAPHPPTRGMASTLFDALIPSTVYTGLECDPLTPQLGAFFGVPNGGGLLVTGVNPNSPAAAAGLAAGDVILRAAGKPTDTRGALAHALRDGKGKPVLLAVMRARREVPLSLQPGKRKKL